MRARWELWDLWPELCFTVACLNLSLSHAGGELKKDGESGDLVLEGGQSLAITVGHLNLKYASGDAVSDVQLAIIMEDTVPLFHYPFDQYIIEMDIKGSLISNPSNPEDITYTSAPIGLILYEGEQGWLTESSVFELTSAEGVVRSGTHLRIVIQRSSSVRFFSMFIVIIMWAVSLAMFVLALNFVFSQSMEVAYDVPALAVGLLFALPFVRDVQPSVPSIGITIDIMGFFFNLLLIAISTVLVMGAISSRYHRAEKLKVQKKEARVAKAAASASLDPISAPPTLFASNKIVPLDTTPPHQWSDVDKPAPAATAAALDTPIEEGRNRDSDRSCASHAAP